MKFPNVIQLQKQQCSKGKRQMMAELRIAARLQNHRSRDRERGNTTRDYLRVHVFATHDLRLTARVRSAQPRSCDLESSALTSSRLCRPCLEALAKLRLP
jgi:hypothetical protein